MALLNAAAALVDSFNVGPLVVHRPGPPSQNNFGGYDAAPDVTISLDPVSVHTLSGRDLEQVPEADRTSEMIQLYAKVRLYVADGGQVADRVEYNGRTYRVMHVDDNNAQAGVYTALAALEDE